MGKSFKGDLCPRVGQEGLEAKTRISDPKANCKGSGMSQLYNEYHLELMAQASQQMGFFVVLDKASLGSLS